MRNIIFEWLADFLVWRSKRKRPAIDWPLLVNKLEYLYPDLRIFLVTRSETILSPEEYPAEQQNSEIVYVYVLRDEWGGSDEDPLDDVIRFAAKLENQLGQRCLALIRREQQIFSGYYVRIE